MVRDILVVKDLFLAIIIASWIYWLVAWYLVRAFFRARPKGDAHFQPTVSLLKPVKGAEGGDAALYENFATFCRQDYEDLEIVFGVAEANDPAVRVIRRIQRDFSQRRIRLIVGPTIGANPKTSLMHHLSLAATSEILLMSDGDIRVTSDYCRRLIAPLADPAIGLVSCLYRGEDPASLTARLESLYIDVTFMPSVIVASKMGMQLAFGATCAMRRADLERAGGLSTIVDYLAEDHQLARLIGRLGLKTSLVNYVVSSVLGVTTFREQWDREVRWLRGIRVSCPGRYPGMLMTFSTPLALLLAMMPLFGPGAAIVLLISILLRWLVTARIQRYLGRERSSWDLRWLPVRDVLTSLIWSVALFGRKVIWRNKLYELCADGRLREISRQGDERWVKPTAIADLSGD